VGLAQTFDRKPGPDVEPGRMHPNLEVVMRPPEVFVRELSPAEAQKLKRASTGAKHRSKRIRAMILLASATEMSAPEIARLYMTDESHVRKVIHEFNERGFSSLDPDYRGGRPSKTTPAERDAVVALARTRPDHQGVAATRWSIPKLSAHLDKSGLAVLSETALRHLLDDAGLSFQRTRSWKWSPDPDFRAKAERVLTLYREPPTDGPVVCFDEMGPIQLIPHQGSGWAPVGRPERLRATYKRPHGVRYFFGALDVHADRLFGRLRERKTALDVLGFLKTVRMRYPSKRRIHLVMDNLSTHWTTDIRAWAAGSNVELVPTPTYASYLNRIECHFAATSEFVVKGADYPDWPALQKALADYIGLRNGSRRDARIDLIERRKRVA
jgi:transposase